MLDFFIQLAAMGLGYTLGTMLFSQVFMRLSDVLGHGSKGSFLPVTLRDYARHFLPLLSLVLTGVPWIPITYQKGEEPGRSQKVNAVLLLLVPAASLLLVSFVLTLLLKAVVLIPLAALALETIIRVLLLLLITSFLPLPPLPGWHVLMTLLERRPTNNFPWFFPSLLFGVFVLELLTKFVILATFFGRLTDTLLQYLYLIG